MISDNRTNEPTPEQVEAAAKALREMRDFDEGVSSLLLGSWSRMVATTALKAAAGVAPEDSGKCGGCRDLGPHRNVPSCDYYKPPQPSRAVDVDALAEVIAHAESDWQFKFDQFRSETGVDPGPKAEFVARAVAEWLKEQGK